MFSPYIHSLFTYSFTYVKRRKSGILTTSVNQAERILSKGNLKIYLLIRTAHIFYDDMFEVSGVGSLSRNCIFLTTDAQLLSFTTRSKLNKNKISNLNKRVAVFLVRT